jgi:putative oxidoreductase
LVEVGSGLLLAAGLTTPLAAAMFISVMLVASVTVHLAKGFFVQEGGCEYNVALAAGALALAFTGPGEFSLDAILQIDWAGPMWGTAALALGLVGGRAQLLTRRRAAHVQVSEHDGAEKGTTTIS